MAKRISVEVRRELVRAIGERYRSCSVTSVPSNLSWLTDSAGARRDIVDLRSAERTRYKREDLARFVLLPQ